PDDASDVVLDFEVASGLSIVTATPSQGSCEVEEETLVVCALGDLDADASATLTIVTSEASVRVYTQAASASSSTLDTIADHGAPFTTNVTAQTDPGPGPDPDPTPDPDPSTNPPSNPPSNPPRSGGGGGGSSSWLVLAL